MWLLSVIWLRIVVATAPTHSNDYFFLFGLSLSLKFCASIHVLFIRNPTTFIYVWYIHVAYDCLRLHFSHARRLLHYYLCRRRRCRSNAQYAAHHRRTNGRRIGEEWRTYQQKLNKNSPETNNCNKMNKIQKRLHTNNGTVPCWASFEMMNDLCFFSLDAKEDK